MSLLLKSFVYFALIFTAAQSQAASNIFRQNSYNCDLVDIEYKEVIQEDIEFRLREENKDLSLFAIFTTPDARTSFFEDQLIGFIKSCTKDSCLLTIVDSELNKIDFTLDNPQVKSKTLTIDLETEFPLQLVCRDHGRDVVKREVDRIEDQAKKARDKLEREAKRIRDQAKKGLKDAEDGLKKLF